MINNEDIDAIIVTASWFSIDKIILPLLEYRIPCFIEKPIALSSKVVENIIDIIDIHKTHIQIGYNRRFYNYNNEIKKYINNNPIRSVIVEIPEPLDISDIKLGQYLWFQNSTHILDMMKNYFGDYFIISNKKTKFINDKYHDTFNLLLSTKTGVPIHLIANWNVPSNFGITINFKNTIIKISPLESGYLYKGFDIIEPTVDLPIRRYNPKIIKEYKCSKKDDIYKPGFLNQHKYFFNLMDKKERNNYNPTSLKDILFYSKFIESVYK